MPCYYPMSGYRSRTTNASGKRGITFNINQGFKDQPVEIPCGQCIGCKLERSRQWAMRCVHEASLHENNMFLTLTYNNEKLPKDNSLNKKHFQDFMKRYRKWSPHSKIRYFHCGEYGENFARPHYHAIIFGHEFADKKLHKQNNNGDHLYTSEKLNELWTHGYCLIGNVTFESAAYVARYVTKKITGENALYYYNEIDPETGELLTERTPEYVTMSRRPGIGKQWFDRFNTDVFPSDEVILRGKKLKPPKYYSKLHEIADPQTHAKLKRQRIAAAKDPKIAQHNTYERLQVREFIQQEKFKQLKRNYEK